jgi:hypothetical protein
MAYDHPKNATIFLRKKMVALSYIGPSRNIIPSWLISHSSKLRLDSSQMFVKKSLVPIVVWDTYRIGGPV